MKRNGQRAVPKACRPINQVSCGMGDAVVRIVAGVGVQLDFQHVGRDWGFGIGDW